VAAKKIKTFIMPNIVALKLSTSHPIPGGHKDSADILVLDQLALQQQISANFIFHAISNYSKIIYGFHFEYVIFSQQSANMYLQIIIRI